MGDDAKMSTKPTFFGEAHTSRLDAAAPDADVVLPGLELPEPEPELELELHPAAAATTPVSASPQINPRTFIRLLLSSWVRQQPQNPADRGSAGASRLRSKSRIRLRYIISTLSSRCTRRTPTPAAA